MDMNWIPTSKALPEMRGNFLVTVKLASKEDMDFDYKFVSIDHYNGDGKWTENHSKYKKVIAWMPVPDEYEEYER